MLRDGLMKETDDSPPSSSSRGATFRSLCASRHRRVLIGSLLVVGLVVVLGLAVAGIFTQSHSTPSIGERSGSSSVMVEGSSLQFSFIDWRSGNGTYVLIMDDADFASHWTHGHTSSDSPYSTGDGGAYVEDGNGNGDFTYSTQTTLYKFTYSTLDGATVDFFVDGTLYDLSQGNVFLITTYDVSPVQVQQLALDLGSVDFLDDEETMQELLSQNEDIVAFVERKASHGNDDV